MSEGITDPLDLSDEDFAALSDEDVAAMFDEPASDDAGSDVSTDNEEDLDSEDVDPDLEEAPAEDADELPAEDDLETDPETDKPVEGDDEEAEPDEGDKPKEGESDEVDDAATDEENKDETPAEASAEDFMKEITAPFRANGKDMQIDSVEDVRKLMQMGANYNKKMAAIKPNLKFIKMLENNDLLNEESISYLIDLQKKDPAAIKKLLKDSGTNPL